MLESTRTKLVRMRSSLPMSVRNSGFCILSTTVSSSVSTLTGSSLSLPKMKAGATISPACSRLTSTCLPESDDMRHTSVPLTTMSAVLQGMPASA